MDNGHVAVLVEALEPRHGVLEAEMVVELAQARRLDADPRPCAIIGIVSVGYDGVEAVVAAGQLDDYQDTIFLRHTRRSSLRPGRSAHYRTYSAEREATKARAQKITASHAADARKHGNHCGLPCSLSCKAAEAARCGRLGASRLPLCPTLYACVNT